MTDKQQQYIEGLVEKLIENSDQGIREEGDKMEGFMLSNFHTQKILIAGPLGLYGRIELTNDEYTVARQDIAAQVNEWVDGGAEIPEMNTQLASAVIDQLKRNGLANGWAAMHQYAPQVVRDAKGR